MIELLDYNPYGTERSSTGGYRCCSKIIFFMKDSWIKEFDKLADIVNESDPVGLIAGGAPLDEYEFEILEIFLKIKKHVLHEEDLRDQVLEVFVNSFGEDTQIDHEKIQKIAMAINETEV